MLAWALIGFGAILPHVTNSDATSGAIFIGCGVIARAINQFTYQSGKRPTIVKFADKSDAK